MSAGVVLPTEVGGELVTATAWLTDHVTAKTAATSAGTITQRLPRPCRADEAHASPCPSRTSPPAEAEQTGNGQQVHAGLGEGGQPDAGTDRRPDKSDRESHARPPASVAVARSALHVAAVTAATSTSRRSCQAGDPSSPTTVISPAPTATVAATITRSPRGRVQRRFTPGGGEVPTSRGWRGVCDWRGHLAQGMAWSSRLLRVHGSVSGRPYSTRCSRVV